MTEDASATALGGFLGLPRRFGLCFIALLIQLTAQPKSIIYDDYVLNTKFIVIMPVWRRGSLTQANPWIRDSYPSADWRRIFSANYIREDETVHPCA